MWIFTITGGRTGTAWLVTLIRNNLGIEAVHEYLGINDIGIRTPDIRVMRNFNNYGFNNTVEKFWSQKIATLPIDRDYFEANHTLAKAGLVEALATRSNIPPVTFILLRRNWVDQILSYIMRNDFVNVTIPWQWYLLPTYSRRIVDPKKFENVCGGGFGMLAWYVAEIEARQEYYRLLFSDNFRFIYGQLEDISTPSGAQYFLGEFGHSGKIELADKVNVNKRIPPPKLREQVEQFVSQIKYDALSVARDFVESGGKLSSYDKIS